jgi:predicted dehydrogenase
MKQVRIALIGAGLRSGIAKYWHKPDGDSIVVAAADISYSKLKEFQEKINPEAFITQDYKELLSP